MAFTPLTFSTLEVLSSTKMTQLYANTSTTYLDGTFAFSPSKSRYLVISPTELVPQNDGEDYSNGAGITYSGSATETATLRCGIHLPNGAVVTSLKVYWFRNDASAGGGCLLRNNGFSGGASTDMADASSNASSGYHSVEDTSISDATIDNTAKTYHLFVSLNPNDDAADVGFTGAVITYTITSPLP